MKKISSVFWISVGHCSIGGFLRGSCTGKFRKRDREYEELHHFIIRLVLFTRCHRNCTVLPVLYRQSDGANYAWRT